MKRGWFVVTVGGVILGLFAISAWTALGKSEPEKGSPSAERPAAKKQFWHCGMHPQVIQDHPGDCPICHMALTPVVAAGDHGIEIDPRVVQNMGVRTQVVTKGRLTRTVRTVGLLALPETGMRDVSLKVNGWIVRLYANQEGIHVHKGEPLFDVYSPELMVAAQELASSGRRLRNLSGDVSKAMRDQAAEFVETAKRKLRLWDVGEEEIDAILTSDRAPETLPIRSPVSGHIEEKMVVEGGAVQPGMKLLRIADHGKMWLGLDIYSESISLVEIGQDVTAGINGIPGRRFSGKVDFIYPHLDHMSRTLRVRATLENPDFQLKPGMYATAELHVVASEEATLCPTEAVIDTGTKQIVFVPEGEGHFVAREIRTGQTGDDNTIEIVQGLAPGDAVVTSGQFLMDAESRTVEAVRMLAGGSATQQPSTTPATTGPSATLVTVFCPMVKATWIQTGKEIHNPYMGKKMPDCGKTKGELSPPPPDSPLRPVVDSYLKVARGLETDNLDREELKRLGEASAALPQSLADVKTAAAAFAKSGDLRSARAALGPFSEALTKAVASQQK